MLIYFQSWPNQKKVTIISFNEPSALIYAPIHQHIVPVVLSSKKQTF